MALKWLQKLADGTLDQVDYSSFIPYNVVRVGTQPLSP